MGKISMKVEMVLDHYIYNDQEGNHNNENVNAEIYFTGTATPDLSRIRDVSLKIVFKADIVNNKEGMKVDLNVDLDGEYDLVGIKKTAEELAKGYLKQYKHNDN